MRLWPTFNVCGRIGHGDVVAATEILAPTKLLVSNCIATMGFLLPAVPNTSLWCLTRPRGWRDSALRRRTLLQRTPCLARLVIRQCYYGQVWALCVSPLPREYSRSTTLMA
jgi:hypothetical protein